MNGDFTRDTFDPKNHYQRVLMQQGRVQLDADWNEQASAMARRDDTTSEDLIGHCGGPADNAAFRIATATTQLLGDQLAWFNALPASERTFIQNRLQQGDFLLTAGRYYVDGLQCEVEHPVLFTRQPDRGDLPLLEPGKNYLVYLDVWPRHITALDDASIRESALGGPDTATRVKIVWQVRTLDVDSVLPGNPCASGAAQFGALRDPLTAQLTADTVSQPSDQDPCIVPPDAGFTGLENQLYRIEIHEPGTAIDAASTAGTSPVTLPGAGDPPEEITVNTGTWNIGDYVEVFPTKPGESPLRVHFARIIDVQGLTLKLDPPVAGFVQDHQPRLRQVSAIFKWSRENGSVATRITKIDGRKITVANLGPDQHLGFRKDDWVEILDDQIEWEAHAGGPRAQLVQILDVSHDRREITFNSIIVPLDASAADGVAPDRHPKLRRWEGVAGVKFAAADADNWLPLESGVRIRFATAGSYRSAQYWQVPARAATAQSPTGDIQWPRDPVSTRRLPQPPRGIAHHFCRLGIIQFAANGAMTVDDCRCLFPPATAVPRLFYVSGDGQEVMPDVAAPAGTRFNLPHPLIVGIPNAQCRDTAARVRFQITQGTGQVAPAGQAATQPTVEVSTDAAGLARCDFHLDGINWTQQVTARLLDQLGNPVSLPIRFNAFLSIASQVAYRPPENCETLQGQTTVQAAITRLASVPRLQLVGGDGQDAPPGIGLIKPIQVSVTSRCRPIPGAAVRFEAEPGGIVAVNSAQLNAPRNEILDITTDPNGIASCFWLPANDSARPTQQLTATFLPPAGTPAESPRSILVTANLRLEQARRGCCFTIGRQGDFATLADAVKFIDEHPKLTELCLCLLPGIHIHDIPTQIRPGRDPFFLEIHGSGPGTRLVLDNAPLMAENLTSIVLRDFDIDTQTTPAPLQFLGCREVVLDSCGIRTNAGITSLVTIAQPETERAAARVVIRDCQFESRLYWWITPPIPVAEIPELNLPVLSPDAPIAEMRANLDAVAKQLAVAPLAPLEKFRESWRTSAVLRHLRDKKFKRQIDGALRLLTPPFDNQNREANSRAAAFALTFGRCLTLINSPDALQIANSQFIGDIHLFGDGPPVSVPDAERLAGRLADQVFPAPKGDWQLHANQLWRITVDEKLLQDTNPPRGLPQRLRLESNSAVAQELTLFAAQLDCSNNQFGASRFPIAILAGRIGTIIGNSAEPDKQLIVAGFKHRLPPPNVNLDLNLNIGLA